MDTLLHLAHIACDAGPVEHLACAHLTRLLESADRIGLIEQSGRSTVLLRGRDLALINQFVEPRQGVIEAAAARLGARVARVGIRDVDSVAELQATARMLGKLYDAVDCGTLPAAASRIIGRYAGIPVFDGLDRADHPARVLADLLCLKSRGGSSAVELSLDRPLGLPSPPVSALLRLTDALNQALPEGESTSRSPQSRGVVQISVEETSDGTWRLRTPSGIIEDSERERAYRLIVQATLCDAMRVRRDCADQCAD